MSARSHDHRRLGDFTTSSRVLVIAAIAVIVATTGVFAGIVLLNLIRLCTNIAYFGRFSLAEADLATTPLGLAAVLVPVADAPIIGLLINLRAQTISAALCCIIFVGVLE
jgi:CIC family chloride channel protein